MARLSEYTNVTVPGSSDFLFLTNSGVNNSRIPLNNFLGGSTYSIQARSGYKLSGSDKFNYFDGTLYIDKSGSSQLINPVNYHLVISSTGSTGGTNSGQFCIGIDESGYPHLSSFGKNLIIQDSTKVSGASLGLFGHPNVNFGVSFSTSGGPSGNNIYNWGSSSYRWLSGYFNNLNTVNLNVAGATTGIFPDTSGQSGKALTNNGSGVFSWVTSGAGGGSTSPGGLNTYIQYNSSGSFSGVPNFTLSGTIVSVTGSQNIYSNRTDTSSLKVISSGEQDYIVNFAHPSGDTHIFNRSGNVTLNNYLAHVGNSPNLKLYTIGLSGLVNGGGGIEVGYSSQRGQLAFSPQFSTIDFVPNIVDYPTQGFKIGAGAGDLVFQCLPAAGQYVSYQSYGGYGIKIQTNSYTSPTNGEIIFAPQIYEKARFDYRGFLGIGTASPTGTLHVVTQYDNAHGIVLAPSGTGQAVNLFECRSSSGTKNIFIDTAVRLNADTIIVNSGLSGAAYIWPMAYGWSFPSGTISGTGTNMSYEIPVLLPCIANYAQARAKVSGSGHPSGLVFDIKVTGSSIWNITPANRLTIPNGTNTGAQSSFDSQIISRGSYLSIDFVYMPTGVYPQDVVVELLTLAQR